MTAGEGLNYSQGSLGRTSLTRLSLSAASPLKRRGEFGVDEAKINADLNVNKSPSPSERDLGWGQKALEGLTPNPSPKERGTKNSNTIKYYYYDFRCISVLIVKL